MIKLQLLISLSLFSYLSFSQYSAKDMYLNGKVMIVYEYCFKLKIENDTFTKSEDFSEERYFFNNKGLKTENSSFGSSKNLLFNCKYDYNEQNKLKNYIFKGSQGISESKYSYNENSKTILMYKNGDFNKKEEYNLDKNGNEILKLTFDKDNTQEDLIVSRKYTYDDNNNVLEMQLFYNNELNSFSKYKYNKRNLLIERSDFKPDGSRKRTESYKYDEYNNATEWIYDSYKKDIYSYKYTYDENNNWIKKIVYKNNEATDIYERKIFFYE